MVTNGTIRINGYRAVELTFFNSKKEYKSFSWTFTPLLIPQPFVLA